MNTSPVTLELIKEIPDKRGALRACVGYSGRALKSVAYELEIDPGHLSKMLNVHADPRHFPPEKENRLMDICGNEIPLLWSLMSRGYQPPTTVELLRQENEALRRENDRLREENISLRTETRVVVGNIFKTVVA